LFFPSTELSRWYIDTLSVEQAVIGRNIINVGDSINHHLDTILTTVPIVHTTKSNNGGSPEITTFKRGFNPTTGNFDTTISNGVYSFTSTYRNPTTNISFPVFEKTIDSSGSYVDSSVTRYIWDTTKVQLLEARKILSNDSICTKITYDNYGNRIKITSPQNDTVFYYYDDSLHTFITRMKMKAGDTTAAFDNMMRTVDYPKTGAKKYDISINNDTTFYYYSSYGELDSVKRPMETGNWSSKTVYQRANRLKIDSVKVDNGQWTVTKSYFNEFYWPIKTTTNGLTSDEEFISEIQYDKMGRVLRTNRLYKLASDTVWTKYFYDALGRKTIIQYPDGSCDSALYNSSYSTVIDKMGHRRKTIFNNHLQVSKTVFGESYQDTIVYYYGPWGKIRTEYDPAGSVILEGCVNRTGKNIEYLFQPGPKTHSFELAAVPLPNFDCPPQAYPCSLSKFLGGLYLSNDSSKLNSILDTTTIIINGVDSTIPGPNLSPMTRGIDFVVEKDSELVTIIVMDINITFAFVCLNKRFPAGNYIMILDSTGLCEIFSSSGIYHAEIKIGEKRKWKKVTLLK
jgi:hypothetical protein